MTSPTLCTGSRLRGALALTLAAMVAAGCATTVSGAPLAATVPASDSGTVSITEPSLGDASGTGQSGPEDAEDGDNSDGAGPVTAEDSTAEPTGPTSREPEKTGAPGGPASPGSPPSKTEPPETEPSATLPPTTQPPAAADLSRATINDHGVITVAAPDTRNAPVIELFEDPLCPYCGAFEASYGDAIAAAVDAGEVIVRYRTVAFLDPYSLSGDYSTRAFAALIALAEKAGDTPGLVADFHAALFNPAVQPAEGGPDLPDADLAELADDLGAPPTAVRAIANGRYIDAASRAAERNLDRLRSLSDSPGTPSIAVDGELVPVQPGWLDALIG